MVQKIQSSSADIKRHIFNTQNNKRNHETAQTFSQICYLLTTPTIHILKTQFVVKIIFYIIYFNFEFHNTIRKK